MPAILLSFYKNTNIYFIIVNIDFSC